MLKVFCVGAGGFLGAISRYLISKLISNQWGNNFPYGTLLVNLVGSFLLGFLMTLFLNKSITNPYLKVAITTGFLGALTTFSTFSYETMNLLQDKEIFLANINIFANLVLGLICVTAGITLARIV
jgi:CrcB protein